nr:hypothetical protein [Helicobacter pylori]
MRVVEDKSKLKNLYLAAETEALSTFGDGSVYVLAPKRYAKHHDRSHASEDF